VDSKYYNTDIPPLYNCCNQNNIYSYLKTKYTKPNFTKKIFKTLECPKNIYHGNLAKLVVYRCLKPDMQVDSYHVVISLQKGDVKPVRVPVL